METHVGQLLCALVILTVGRDKTVSVYEAGFYFEQKWRYKQSAFPHMIPYVLYVFMLKLILLVPQ